MTRIFVNGTGEADNSYYAAPVETGLSAIHFTVDSLAKAVHNFLYNGTDAAVTGTPSFNSSGGIFTDNTSYLTTAFSETTEMTFFVIGKLVSVGTTGACFFSNGGAQAGVFGTNLYATATTGITFSSTRNNAGTNTSAGASISGNVNTNWALYVCQATATGNTVRNITTGASANNNLGSTKVISSGQIRIGANYTSTYDGQTQVLAYIGHNAALTEAEIQQWITRLRKYAAGRGITI